MKLSQKVRHHVFVSETQCIIVPETIKKHRKVATRFVVHCLSLCFQIVLLLALVTKWSRLDVGRGFISYFLQRAGALLFTKFLPYGFCHVWLQSGMLFFSGEACLYRGCHCAHLHEHDRLSVRGVDKHIEQQRHSTTPPVLQAILAGAVYLQSHTLRYRSDEIQLVPDAIDSHPTDSRDVPRHHFARTWGVADCYLCNNCLPVCLVAVSRENYPSDLVENFQSSLFSSTWFKIIQQENNVIT